MKSLITTVLLSSMSIATGALVGCSASGSVEPDHNARTEVRTDTNGSSSSYKKTEVRDANGNLVEKKVETRNGN